MKKDLNVNKIISRLLVVSASKDAKALALKHKLGFNSEDGIDTIIFAKRNSKNGEVRPVLMTADDGNTWSIDAEDTNFEPTWGVADELNGSRLAAKVKQIGNTLKMDIKDVIKFMVDEKL